MNPFRPALSRRRAGTVSPGSLLIRAQCAALWRRLCGQADADPASDTGRWGEAQAEAYLRKSGHRILGRRVRTAHREEIDLIAARGDTLVFIEVKTRGSEDFGRPAEAVGRAKRLILTRAALRYMGRLRRPPPFARFDVIEVVGRVTGGKPLIRHIENAFEPEGGWRTPT